jgi:hypothetical protein
VSDALQTPVLVAPMQSRVLFVPTASTLLAIPKQPAKALSELRAHLSARKQILLLDRELSRAQANLIQKVESFLLQVSDFLPARLLGKQKAFRILKQTLNFAPCKHRMFKTLSRHVFGLLPFRVPS